MKNILLILSLIVFNVYNAQDCFEQKQNNYGVDSSECNKNVNLYQLHLKQKNWTYSSVFWWNTIKACPQFSSKIYKNGTIIYKKIIDQKTKDKSPEVNTYVDTLFMVYDLWFKNYGICDDVVLRSSRDLIKFKAKTEYEKAYTDFKSIYASNKNIFSYSDVNMFFYSAIYMFKNEKINCDAFLNDYENMSDLCDMNIKSGKKVEQFKKVQMFLDNKISPCASCDKLEEIYSAKLKNDSTNMELTKKVFEMLSAKKCTESAFYLELLDKVLNDPNNPPSANDLINAALADHKRADYNKAKERFTKALDITEDEELNQKCYTYLYDIAFKRKKYKEAFNLASSFTDNCLANDKKARAIAASASSCGTSPLERSLIYCLALDYAEKSCGNTNSSTTNAWKGLLLPKKELIMLDVTNGSEQTVPCWSKSVILRTRD